jgi:hypothetical protein
MCIKTNRYVGRLLVVDEIYQCVEESELSVGIFAFAGNSWATNQ